MSIVNNLNTEQEQKEAAEALGLKPEAYTGQQKAPLTMMVQGAPSLHKCLHISDDRKTFFHETAVAALKGEIDETNSINATTGEKYLDATKLLRYADQITNDTNELIYMVYTLGQVEVEFNNMRSNPFEALLGGMGMSMSGGLPDLGENWPGEE